MLDPKLLDEVDRRIARRNAATTDSNQSPEGAATPAVGTQSQLIDPALLDQVDARIMQSRQAEQPDAAASDAPAEGPLPEWGLGGPVGVLNAIGTGVMDAGFQAKDFVMGEPAEEDKSEFRLQNEAAKAQLRDSGIVNNLAMDISQFTMGLVGFGKIMAPIKVTSGAGRFAWEAGRVAAANYVVMDPHEERLSNLLVQFEPLRNPVTEYLAAAPDDTAIEGRLKNMMEGFGFDLLMVGAFMGSLKAIRSFRRGDEAGAKAALQQAEELQVRYDADKAAREAIEGTPSADLDEAFPSRPPSDDMPRPTAERQVADLEVAPQVRPEAGRQSKASNIVQQVRPEDGSVEPVKSEASAVPLRPSDQTYKPSVEVQEPDLKAIITTARQDAEAVARFGSREAAIAAGAVERGGNLPWNRLNSTEEVEALIAATSREIYGQMDAAKGGSVVTDLEQNLKLQRIAEHFNAAPDLVMAEISQSGARATQMVADMEAAYIISTKMFDEAYQLSVRIKQNLLDDFGGDLGKAYAELRRRSTAAADMYAQHQTMRATFGRGLRRLRTEFAVKPEDLAKFNDIPADKLVEILSSTRGDMAKLRDVANPSFLRRVTDEGAFLFTNNLLWNWQTHAVNLSTNLYMLAARPAEKLLGSLMMGTSGSAIRRQAMREYAYTLYSVSDAWSGLVDAFLKADSKLLPYNNEYTQAGLRVGQPQLAFTPIKDTWDLFRNGLVAANYGQSAAAAGKAATATYRTAVGLPTRSLGAIDEFIKQLRYRSVVQARASVEGSDMGLTGAQLQTHVAQRLKAAFTVDGRGVDDAALREAQVTTFQQELLQGTVGRTVQSNRAAHPALHFVLPFVKTPVNVLRYATKMTPGLNLLQKEYRQMLFGELGAEAQAHATGQFALGSLFAATAFNLALGGRITGSGPSDYKLRNALKATGWQPYSIVIGEGDKKTYFPIGRFDPVGLSFGMVADLADMLTVDPENRSNEASIMAAVIALSKAFTDKTFLMNINQALEAVTNPGEDGEGVKKFFGNLGGSMIPGSSAIRTYANQDPYLRDARDFMDRVMSGLPGYSQSLPSRRDAFGEPIWRKRGLTTTSDPDLVESEHNRIILDTGHSIGLPTAVHEGVDLRTVKLSDGRNAYDAYQELIAQPQENGPGLKETLARLIESEGYAKLTDGAPEHKGTKIGALMDVVSKFRTMGKASLLRQYPELRQTLAQGQLDVRNRLREQQGNSNQRPGVRDMLRDMGY